MFSRLLKRGFSCAIVCLLAVAMLGAGGDSSASRYGRVGHNLMCVCGCGQVLLECNHVGCPDSARMIGELQDEINGPNGTGADSLILNWFVAKYGATVLAAPLRGGFDIVAWIVPLSLFVLATLGTGFLVKMWAGRRRLAGGAGMSMPLPPIDDEVRARIRRDTEFL